MAVGFEYNRPEFAVSFKAIWEILAYMSKDWR
jgi:hypothetical protein